MGFRKLFKKQKRNSSADKRRFAQVKKEIDHWLLTGSPLYMPKLDTTVPVRLERGRRRASNDVIAEYEQYQNRIIQMLDEHGLNQFDMYSIYQLYEWIDLYSSTALEMAYHAPSNLLIDLLGIYQIEVFYENVYSRVGELCLTIENHIKQNICNRTHTTLTDHGEARQCEHLIRMMLGYYEYFVYLYRILTQVYHYAPYLKVDEEYFISGVDVDKTFRNINQHIKFENWKNGCTSQEQFKGLIEYKH